MEAKESVGLSKAQQDRLAYIEFCCFFLGEAKRSDITDRFGVQTAAATRDFAEYRKLAKIELDQQSKSYRPARGFQPIFNHPVEHVLASLALGFGASSNGSTKPLVRCEAPQQLNTPALEILATVTRAIYQRRPAKIRYNSFSSGENLREIVPFALANNGLRWHVRAYCRLRKRFADFVLTRVSEAAELPGSDVAENEKPDADIQWNRIVELEIAPHPKRKKDAKVIAMDYGMVGGVLRRNVRAALAGYFLRQWGVDSSKDGDVDAEEIRLWLRNHLALYGVESAKFAPGFQEFRGLEKSIRKPST